MRVRVRADAVICIDVLVGVLVLSYTRVLVLVYVFVCHGVPFQRSIIMCPCASSSVFVLHSIVVEYTIV